MALNNNCGGVAVKGNKKKIQVHQDIRILEALNTVLPPHWVLPHTSTLEELPNLEDLSQVLENSESSAVAVAREHPSSASESTAYIEITDDELDVATANAATQELVIAAPPTPQPSASTTLGKAISQAVVDDDDEFDFDEPPPTPRMPAEVVPTTPEVPAVKKEKAPRKASCTVVRPLAVDDDFADQPPPPKMPKMHPIRETSVRASTALHQSLVRPASTSRHQSSSSRPHGKDRTTTGDAAVRGKSARPSSTRHQSSSSQPRGKDMTKLIMTTPDDDAGDNTEDSPRQIIVEARRKLKKLKVKNTSARTELIQERSVVSQELDRLRLEIDRLEQKSRELDQKVEDLDISDRQIDSLLGKFD